MIPKNHTWWRDDMMRQKRKVSGTFLLVAVLIFGILIRYPWADSFHEAGADGSYYAALSQIISRFGRAPWTVSPFSYFGLFPFSEGIATPVLLSGFTAESGLPINLAVLAMTDMFALVGALGVFLCVVRITRSAYGGVIGALAFLTAPILLLYSDQTLTSRFYAACWTPFLLLVFVDHRKWGQARTLMVGSILAVLLATTHLSFVLIFAMFFGILVLMFIEGAWTRMRTKLVAFKPLKTVSKFYYISFLSASALLLVATSYVPAMLGEGSSGLGSYDVGVFQGTSHLAYFGNLLVSTVGGAGILAAFLTFFSPRLWNMANRQFTLPALAAIFLVIALLSVRLYSRPFVATVMSIGAGLGFVGLKLFLGHRGLRRWKSSIAALAVFFILTSVGTSVLIEQRWSSEESFRVSGTTYSTFLYAKQFTRGNLYCNQYPTDRFLTAYTGIVCSPALPGSDLDMVPFITGSIPWSQPTFKPRDLLGVMTSRSSLGLYDVVGYAPYEPYFQISNAPSSANRDLLERYDVTYALEYRAVQGDYAIRWTFESPQPSALLRSLRDSSYITYQDSEYSIWYI